MTRPVSFTISRRLVLKSAAALSLAAYAPSVLAQETSGPAILSLADLHSPYARLPALLTELERRAATAPHVLLINGDLFERGNAAALRSEGAADWAFLERAAGLMPVVVNLGNHETALLDDMTLFVERAEAAGITVLSNLVDSRTGEPFAPDRARLDVGGMTVAILGLATDNPFVYRQPVRDTLTFVDPVAHAEQHFSDATDGADLRVLMSHAGVQADKAILPGLPAGTLVLAAHDHLDLMTDETGTPYMHHASWGTRLGVTPLDDLSAFSSVEITPGAGDATLAQQIAEVKRQHLTEEDNAVIATLTEALDMHASILVATEAVREAAGADVAVLGHTTFGAPLARGSLTRYDFDAFVRFGGPIAMAEISGEALQDVLARANQFAAQSLDARTGDYVHVAEIDVDPAATYRIATNGWTARNQASYLGTEDLAFAEVDGLELKSVIAAHLSNL